MLHLNSPLLFMLLPLELIARLCLSQRVQGTKARRLAARGRFLHGIKLIRRTQVFLPHPCHSEDGGFLPVGGGCGVRKQLAAVVLLRRGVRKRRGRLEQRSRWRRFCRRVAHEDVEFWVAPAVCAVRHFLRGTNSINAADPSLSSSYFWPQSISFLFSPTDPIIPKQKETRNCSQF